MLTHLLPNLDDAGRDKALARTHELMKKLEAQRRQLESIPVELLPLMVEVYRDEAALVAREALDKARAENMQVLPWKIVSRDENRVDMKIKRGNRYAVVARPQWCTCRVEGLEIDGDPTRWLVDEIKVGNKSQSIGWDPRPMPGERFRKGGFMSELKLERLHSGMDFTLLVEYVGPLDEGEVFEATAIARVIE